MQDSLRTPIDLEKLLSPLSGEPSGVYLRYEPIYDQIKEARREEDPNLSQGVWQTDIKRADWLTAENLCLKAFESTKDLQIALWLMESWLAMDHFEGLSRGSSLILNLSQKFWDTLHPVPENDDFEFRTHMYDWMDEEINRRLMLTPITFSDLDPGSLGLNFSDWISAVNLDQSSKRSSDSKRIIQEAESKGLITLPRYRSSLAKTPYHYLKHVGESVVDSLNTINELRSFLQNAIPQNTPNFTNLRKTLGDIERICTSSLATRPEPTQKENLTKNGFSSGDIEEVLLLESSEESPPNQNNSSQDGDGPKIISERSDAYEAIREIGKFLEALDPHSPTPHLLQLVGEWENRTLGEILTHIAKSPVQTQTLLKMLASSVDLIKEPPHQSLPSGFVEPNTMPVQPPQTQIINPNR